MSSMIILEYKIIHGAEKRNADVQLLKELEDNKVLLEKKVAERTADFANKVAEMKKIQDKLIQDELTMINVKNEIEQLEAKNNPPGVV